MILSDKDLRNRILQDTGEAQKAKEWWKKGEWDNIGNKIVIDPFDTYALGACCYDFSVGEEYLSLREPEHPKPLTEGQHFRIGPGETVLILSKEYICLPKDVLAMIVPRATCIFEGTSLSATRIDPTWYGKLLIGFTNLAKNPVSLDYGEAFCTCYFMQATETILTRDKVKFLGRTKIGSIKFTHALEQKLMSAEKVDQDDIEKVVELYGWPWDVVRGMFKLNQKLLKDYIDKEVYSNLLEDAVSATSKEVTKGYRTLIYVLVGLGAAVVGLIGFLGYLFYLSSP